MPLLATATGNPARRTTGPVADEIANALLRHSSTRRGAAHGLILGLEKYRQLRARTTGLRGAYQGLPLVIDASQPQRVSVF